ncbi:MAG: Pirin [Fibrobacteres bacterium]|nr:Pirin [Fibrobacterota bacterium]
MNDVILGATPLGFPWQTPDPFLFCAYHHDGYPAGNEKMGPAASLAGRDLGNDFEGKDGWRMYHGETVPGFPQHPHRGFETVTIARRGYIDHADSLGAVARFGRGDVQWVTAGRGLSHSEMFPLIDRNGPNPVELFQIWLNLPKADKLADPYFTMLWSEGIPVHREQDSEGRNTEVTVVAGRLGDSLAPQPPPQSWAAHVDADVGIWTLRMDPRAEWALPPAAKGANRTLYFFRGGSIRIGDREFRSGTALRLKADERILLRNGSTEAEFLLLQGRPIGEPVVQYGPFVMNTRSEIEQAFTEYQSTQFGGWPWPSDDPVQEREAGRFARHADGRIEKPQ